MERDEETEQLLRLLVPINGLAPNYQDQLLQSAEILEFKRRETVFHQGSRDNYSYYLLKGELELYAGDQLIKQVEGGTGPSFHPLAQLQPRQVTGKAKTAVAVLRIDRLLLDKLLSLVHSPAQETGVEVVEMDGGGSQDEWIARMLQSELFSRIPPLNIQKLLSNMESLTVKSGDVIVRQGDPGDYYYILKSGRCEVTRRTRQGSHDVRLAELAAVTSFGEEALVADSRRNATVRMLTDGELVRLTKEKFVELIKKPLLKNLRFDEAKALVGKGAVWVDVRLPEEYRQGHLPGSINIPLNVLRIQFGRLDAGKQYIACCDTGSRSSVAAFLLTERGYDALCVDGGCMAQFTPADSARTAAAAPAAPPAALPVDEMNSVDADVVASSLKTELAKAAFQLEEAKRLKAEAEAAKQSAEKEIEAKLRAERTRLEADARKAAEILAEARRIKDTLENQKREADEEAAKRHSEQEARLAKLRTDAEERLREEETRLRETYRAKAEELEKVLAERAESEKAVGEERRRLEAESTQSKRLLEEARRALDERRAEEKTLRRKNEEEIAVERRKLEAVFAKNAAVLMMAQREKEAAEAAKRAAAEEAETMIAEYRALHEQQRAAQQAEIKRHVQQLEAERERLRVEMLKIAATRDEAEQLLSKARAAAEKVRTKQGAQGSSGPNLRKLQVEAAAADAEALGATRKLHDALEAQQKIQSEQLANQEKLVDTYHQQEALRAQLAKELDEWLHEVEKVQSTTAGREWLKNQNLQSDRIKRKAEQAKLDAQTHDANLLAELQAQFGAG